MDAGNGYHRLSKLSLLEAQRLSGDVVNFMVNSDGEMYFHLNHERYYVDRVHPKHDIPKELTGGLLEFPDRKKPGSVRGALIFAKNSQYYLLAFASKKERVAWAMMLGKIN